MRLRKPCEHDRYDEHTTNYGEYVPQIVMRPGTHIVGGFYEACPGGDFLPEDTTGLTADLIQKALAKPDSKWSRGTILDAAVAYSRIVADG